MLLAGEVVQNRKLTRLSDKPGEEQFPQQVRIDQTGWTHVALSILTPGIPKLPMQVVPQHKGCCT